MYTCIHHWCIIDRKINATLKTRNIPVIWNMETRDDAVAFATRGTNTVFSKWWCRWIWKIWMIEETRYFGNGRNYIWQRPRCTCRCGNFHGHKWFQCQRLSRPNSVSCKTFAVCNFMHLTCVIRSFLWIRAWYRNLAFWSVATPIVTMAFGYFSVMCVLMFLTPLTVHFPWSEASPVKKETLSLEI